MIECTEFIGNLMNKQKFKRKKEFEGEKKFQHVLQTDEMLTETIQIDERLLNKKRRKINIEIEDDENEDKKFGDVNNIFDSSWRT